MRPRSRSGCSSSAASGKRTRRSMAASATPICRSGRSPIPAPASTQRRQGRAARRLCLRRRQCLRVHLDDAGRTGRARGRIRRADPSAIPGRIRERHRGRLAPRALDAGLRRQLDRRDARRSTTTISARSTAASCWPASTPPTSRPGRRARSSRRSMRSRGCTSAWSNGMIERRIADRLRMIARGHRARAGAVPRCRRMPPRRRRRAGAFSPASVHRADRRGTVRQCLPGLPHARRQGRDRRRRLSGAGSNTNLEAGGYPVYVVVRGQRACRRSAR